MEELRSRVQLSGFGETIVPVQMRNQSSPSIATNKGEREKAIMTSRKLTLILRSARFNCLLRNLPFTRGPWAVHPCLLRIETLCLGCSPRLQEAYCSLKCKNPVRNKRMRAAKKARMFNCCKWFKKVLLYPTLQRDHQARTSSIGGRRSGSRHSWSVRA